LAPLAKYTGNGTAFSEGDEQRPGLSSTRHKHHRHEGTQSTPQRPPGPTSAHLTPNPLQQRPQFHWQKRKSEVADVPIIKRPRLSTATAGSVTPGETVKELMERHCQAVAASASPIVRISPKRGNASPKKGLSRLAALGLTPTSGPSPGQKGRRPLQPKDATTQEASSGPNEVTNRKKKV